MKALFTLFLVLAVAPPAAGVPVVFWASDPVRSGETAMVLGDGFGEKPSVEVVRLEDGPAAGPSRDPAAWPGGGREAEVLQASDQSVKFVLPLGAKSGVFAYRITSPVGTAVGLLNRPDVWWAQGGVGTAASPGGWVRVFGKNQFHVAPGFYQGLMDEVKVWTRALSAEENPGGVRRRKTLTVGNDVPHDFDLPPRFARKVQ